MAQVASTLFFVMLFVGCGAALQRLVAAHWIEVASALAGAHARPAMREFTVTVRRQPARAAAARATA